MGFHNGQHPTPEINIVLSIMYSKCKYMLNNPIENNYLLPEGLS